MTSPAVGTGIVAFIEARLDELEAIAREAITDDGGLDVGFEGEFAKLTGRTGSKLDFVPRFGDAAARMIATVAVPRWILGQVAKDRAILALHRPEEAAVGGPMCAMCNPWRPDAAYPCQTVRLLAAIDADHPDHRPEWKPVAG